MLPNLLIKWMKAFYVLLYVSGLAQCDREVMQRSSFQCSQEVARVMLPSIREELSMASVTHLTSINQNKLALVLW